MISLPALVKGLLTMSCEGLLKVTCPFREDGSSLLFLITTLVRVSLLPNCVTVLSTLVEGTLFPLSPLAVTMNITMCTGSSFRRPGSCHSLETKMQYG